MIADFHNDVLTSEKREKVFAKYKKSENVIVCAIFKGKRDEKKLLRLAEFFKNNKSENLYLSFEDFSITDEKIADKLLSFAPAAVSLTWNNANFLAGGAKSDGELTESGKKLIKKLNEKKIALDGAHLSEKSFFAAIELADTFVVTHTGFKGICDVKRNISDEQIKLTIEKRGLIGLAFYAEFLGTSRGGDENAVVKSVDYFAQKFGVKNLCLGTDFFGCEDFPCGYGDYRFEERFTNGLTKLGYKTEQINAIKFGNLFAFLSRAQ